MAPQEHATQGPRHSVPDGVNFAASGVVSSRVKLADLTPELSRALETAERVLRLLTSHFADGPLPALTGSPLAMIRCQLGRDCRELRELIRGPLLGVAEKPDEDCIQVQNLSHQANVALYQLRVAERSLTAWANTPGEAVRQRVPSRILRQFEAAVGLLRDATPTPSQASDVASRRGGSVATPANMTADDPAMTQMREAIKKHPNGRKAKAETLCRAAGIAEKEGRDALRKLEALREYEGFQRKRPRRYG